MMQEKQVAIFLHIAHRAEKKPFFLPEHFWNGHILELRFFNEHQQLNNKIESPVWRNTLKIYKKYI